MFYFVVSDFRVFYLRLLHFSFCSYYVLQLALLYCIPDIILYYMTTSVYFIASSVLCVFLLCCIILFYVVLPSFMYWLFCFMCGLFLTIFYCICLLLFYAICSFFVHSQFVFVAILCYAHLFFVCLRLFMSFSDCTSFGWIYDYIVLVMIIIYVFLLYGSSVGLCFSSVILLALICFIIACPFILCYCSKPMFDCWCYLYFWLFLLSLFYRAVSLQQAVLFHMFPNVSFHLFDSILFSFILLYISLFHSIVLHFSFSYIDFIFIICLILCMLFISLLLMCASACYFIIVQVICVGFCLFVFVSLCSRVLLDCFIVFVVFVSWLHFVLCVFRLPCYMFQVYAMSLHIVLFDLWQVCFPLALLFHLCYFMLWSCLFLMLFLWSVIVFSFMLCYAIYVLCACLFFCKQFI